MIKRIVIFLVLNFVALGIGGMFTGAGVSSDWYQEMSKAPWTPPGWVFGAAWTTIMICFAVYMAQLLSLHIEKKPILMLFGLQWVLNTAWNPIFFYGQQVLLGLICIVLLSLVVAYFFFKYQKMLKWKTVFIAPYLIWLCIATSLNAYILFNN